jgi:hypothetical protein
MPYTPEEQASGELYHRWTQLRFLKRNQLTFHYLPATTGLDLEPTPDQLVSRVKRTLVALHRATGYYVPMEGVVSPEDNSDDGTPGWPHVHLVLQEKLSESVHRRLRRLSRARWLKCAYSDHPPRHRKEEETDLREYVANHMYRHGAIYLAGENVVTRSRAPDERALRARLKREKRARARASQSPSK